VGQEGSEESSAGANQSQRSESGRRKRWQDNHDFETVKGLRMPKRVMRILLGGGRGLVQLVKDRRSDFCETSDAGRPC